MAEDGVLEISIDSETEEDTEEVEWDSVGSGDSLEEDSTCVEALSEDSEVLEELEDSVEDDSDCVEISSGDFEVDPKVV